MTDKPKQFKSIIIILIILIVLGLAFLWYWYEWRPSQIIKDCYATAKKEAKELMEKKKNLLGIGELEEVVKESFLFKDDFEDCYRNCLRRHGIEK